jgi:hypothetical protein
MMRHWQIRLASYTCYQVIFILSVVLLSSLGAFIHFLLDHEISIIESWLQNYGWEIVIFAKAMSLYTMYYWSKVKSRNWPNFKNVKSLLTEWVQYKSLVLTVFSLLGLIALGGVKLNPIYTSYIWGHLISYFGVFLFYGADIFFWLYLNDQFPSSKRYVWEKLIFLCISLVAFRVSVPDYFKLWPIVLFVYFNLLLITHSQLKRFSNALWFLIIFVGPMNTFMGVDLVWGNDFSPFELKQSGLVTFLVVCGVLSLGYYKLRDSLEFFIKRFKREG